MGLKQTACNVIKYFYPLSELAKIYFAPPRPLIPPIARFSGRNNDAICKIISHNMYGSRR